MNWDRIEGNWKQFKGKAKIQWSQLTDDDLNVIEGKRDQLIGKLQERYGMAKDEAEKQTDEFTRSVRKRLGNYIFDSPNTRVNRAVAARQSNKRDRRPS